MASPTRMVAPSAPIAGACRRQAAGRAMEWRGGWLAWVLIVVTSPFLTGCQGVSIKKIGGGPSVSSAGRVERIGRWARPSSGQPDTPPPPIRGLGVEATHPADPDALIARALASHHAGIDARCTSKDVDAEYQVDALNDASVALDGLTAEPGGRADDPRILEARTLSNSAQEEFLRATKRPTGPARRGLASESGRARHPAHDRPHTAISSRLSGSISSSSS